MKSLKRFASSLLVCLGLALLIVPAGANAEDLEELLQQVGEEYATSYAAPFVHTFGPNLVSNVFSTASIPWHGFTFGFGIKVMAANINEDDQSFSRVIENVAFDDVITVDHPYYDDLQGRTGTILLSGPTIFGNTDTPGTIDFYSGGMLLGQGEGITGLVDTGHAPMAVPELYVGGFFGLKATFRYLPEMDLGDYGKTSFKGYGLQWSASGLLPNLPVDVMAGFFKQQLDIGTLMETTANSYFVAASKDFSVLTVYAGLAKENSEMTLTYEHEALSDNITFSVDGVQENRGILGATVGIPGVQLNAEVAKGSITTYSVGMMFGI